MSNEARVIEKIRQEYNRTLDKAVIEDGFEEYKKVTLFYTWELYLWNLKHAGLRGNRQVFREESKRNFRLTWDLEDDMAVDYFMFYQTGLTPRYEKLIGEFIRKKMEEKGEVEPWKHHPCHGCSGEDCACCSVFLNI